MVEDRASTADAAAQASAERSGADASNRHAGRGSLAHAGVRRGGDKRAAGGSSSKASIASGGLPGRRSGPELRISAVSRFSMISILPNMSTPSVSRHDGAIVPSFEGVLPTWARLFSSAGERFCIDQGSAATVLLAHTAALLPRGALVATDTHRVDLVMHLVVASERTSRIPALAFAVDRVAREQRRRSYEATVARLRSWLEPTPSCRGLPAALAEADLPARRPRPPAASALISPDARTLAEALARSADGGTIVGMTPTSAPAIGCARSRGPVSPLEDAILLSEAGSPLPVPGGVSFARVASIGHAPRDAIVEWFCSGAQAPSGTIFLAPDDASAAPAYEPLPEEIVRAIERLGTLEDRLTLTARDEAKKLDLRPLERSQREAHMALEHLESSRDGEPLSGAMRSIVAGTYVLTLKLAGALHLWKWALDGVGGMPRTGIAQETLRQAADLARALFAGSALLADDAFMPAWWRDVNRVHRELCRRPDPTLLSDLARRLRGRVTAEGLRAALDALEREGHVTLRSKPGGGRRGPRPIAVYRKGALSDTGSRSTSRS